MRFRTWMALATAALASVTAARGQALLTVSPPRPPGALTDAPPEARRALVVGAADYRTLPRLELRPSLDARDTDNLLRFQLGFQARNILTLADIAPYKPPTHANIAIEAERLIAATTPDSSVVLYFSGHGVRYRDEDYLLPIDAVSAEPEEAADNGIPLGDILRRLDARRPRSVLVLLDGSRKLPGMGGPSALKVGPTTAVLYASGSGELSRDGSTNDFNNGVFTRYLLDALNPNAENAANPKGEVTFTLLRAYLQQRVGQYVNNAYAGAKQTPDGFSAAPSATIAKLNQ